MLKWIRGIGFAVIFGLTAPLASAAPAQTPRAPLLLVLGDSLSAEYGIARGTGWVALLQQALKKDGFDYSVVNASISGDTTSDGMARLPALLSRYRPAITVIELGANDALRGMLLRLTWPGTAASVKRWSSIDRMICVSISERSRPMHWRWQQKKSPIC